MGLNLKNQRTHELIRELASLTGESLTGAVTEAVQEKIDRTRREREGDLAGRLLEIGMDCAHRLKEPFRSIEHGDLLYDESGLPK